MLDHVAVFSISIKQWRYDIAVTAFLEPQHVTSLAPLTLFYRLLATLYLMTGYNVGITDTTSWARSEGMGGIHANSMLIQVADDMQVAVT